MIAGIISALFGAVQAFFLKKTLFAVTAGNYTVAAAFLMLKLFLYGAGLALLMVFFENKLVACLVGYAVGLPVAVMIGFALKTFVGCKITGDDENEHSNNN